MYQFIADEVSPYCGGCGRPLTSGVCPSCTPGIPQDPLTPPQPRRNEDKLTGRGRHPLPANLGPRPYTIPSAVQTYLTKQAGKNN